jgi:hypothetical protein
MIDPVAYRVAERIIDREEVRKRIEKIPGWDRSNCRMSLYNTRYPLSEKQKAVLDKIEKEQGARAPQPGGPAHADIQLNARKEYVDHSEYLNIIQALRKKSPVTVYDPKGLIAPNQKAHGFIVHQLALDFWGRAEQYAEYNADEDDPENRQVNEMVQHDAEKAAEVMEKAHLSVKQSGPVTTLTLTPSYPEVLEKHHGRAWIGRR